MISTPVSMIRLRVDPLAGGAGKRKHASVALLTMSGGDVEGTGETCGSVDELSRLVAAPARS